MSKIIIPIPFHGDNGKVYAIEFESDNIRCVDTHMDIIGDGNGGVRYSGKNELKFSFDKMEHSPKWVEYDG